jgi:hypothetical protein
MSILDYLVAMQINGGDQGRSINSTSAEILVVALIAVMFGVIALVFVRTGSKRSHRH